MRTVIIAALAASLTSAAPAALDLGDILELVTEQVSDFNVVVLGGTTLRAEQQYNDNFIAGGRGPRSYLKALGKYSAWGAQIDPQLTCIVDTILQELGFGGLAGIDSSNCAQMVPMDPMSPMNGNPMNGGGNNRGRPGAGNGGGKGGNNGGQKPNGTRPGNGSASQGMCASSRRTFGTARSLTPGR